MPYSLLCKCIKFPLPTILPLLEMGALFSKYSSADVRQYFAEISPTNRVWKNPRSAVERARKELHNETNDHIHWQIFGGRYCESRRFFTSCLFYSMPYSLLCKCIESPYRQFYLSWKGWLYSVSIQVLIFGSILPIFSNKSSMKKSTECIQTSSQRATQWNQWPYTLTNIWGEILWNSSFFHFLFILQFALQPFV